MKVTTIRFGEDLWRLLETEAALADVSTSQYIREAALARAAAAAAARGHGPFELLAGALRDVQRGGRDPDKRADADRVLAALARLAAAENVTEAGAVRSQSQQARGRARKAIARGQALLEPGPNQSPGRGVSKPREPVEAPASPRGHGARLSD